MVRVWLWFEEEFMPYYSSNGFALNAFGCTEIRDWAHLMRVSLTTHEVLALRDLDIAFRIYMTRRQAKGGKSSIPSSDSEGVGSLLRSFGARVVRGIKGKS